MLFIVFMAFVPVLAVTLGVYARQYVLAKRNLISQAAEMARMGSFDQSQIVTATRQLLFSLAQNPRVASFDVSYADSLFAEILRVSPEYANIGLIDRSGMLVASGLPHPSPTFLGDRSYFTKAVESSSYSVGEFAIGRVTGKQSIIFGYPVRNDSGSIVSVVYAAVDLDWLNEREAGFVTLMPDSSLFIETDERGVVIVDPQFIRLIGHGVPQPIARLLETPHPQTVTSNAFDRVMRIYLRADLATTGISTGRLSVLIGIPATAVFLDATRFLISSLISLFAGLIAAALIVWFGVQAWFIRPMSPILSVVGAIGRGDLSARTGLTTARDEIGDLARSVDQMAAALEIKEDQRRVLQSALREGETRFQTLVDQAHDGILETDESERVTFVNRRMAEFVGYSREELVGTDVGVLLFADDAAMAADQIRQRRRGLASRYERRFRHRSGATVWALVSASPVTDARGTYLGSFAVITEITDRIRLEQQLEQERSLLTRFINSLPDPVYLKDTKGRLVFGNQALAAYVGAATPDELIGKTDDDFFPPQIAAELGANERRVVESGTSLVNVEERTADRDGKTRWNLSTQVPIFDQEGNVSGLVGIRRDITARKEFEERLRSTEEQLIQVQKMDAIGQLAGGIAHDFNNILTGIMGFATLLQPGVESQQELAGYVTEILASSRRAADLTHGLLTFSRRQPSNPQFLDLNEVVNQQMQFLGRMIGEDIELRAELVAEPVTVKADAVQMNQILMNLAANARDAMPNGGTITIRTMIESGGARPGTPQRAACITVTDTGTGMDAQTRDRLFEPFFTTKEIGKGTGLGLSIVWGIVEQHGGSVDVQTQIGRGTTFRIRFPLSETAPTAQEPTSAEPPPAAGREKILVVEDDDAVRGLIRSLLEANGYTVLEAADGRAAVELLRFPETDVNLVLLDVIMPKMTGPEAWEIIHMQRPELHAVFMSGYASERFSGHGRLGDEYDVLQKPFTAFQLSNAVRRAFDRSRRS